MWNTTKCGKFLKRWQYQTTLPASWEICLQVKKQQLEVDMEQQTGLNWERSMSGCILSPCLFNLYVEYIMWNARLDEAQAGIKIAGRNINNLRYADDTTLMAESELKSLLMKVQEEKVVTEDEIFGWNQWLNGHEVEQTQGDSEGRASLACCNSWDCKELDMT